MIDRIIKSVGPLDETSMESARRRQEMLTKPRGSLGKLEELSVRIAGIQATARPQIRDKAIIIMAADHGVVAEKVSLYPQEVTRQMVLNFASGNAAINVLSRHTGARVTVIDMGVIGGTPGGKGIICRMIDFGTRNMAKGPAMTRQQAIDSIEAGINTAEDEIKNGLDIVGTGDMGIGNTTASSAIFAAISKKPVSEVTGRGAGIDDKMLAHKIMTIEGAISINKPDPDDAIDVLAKLGGFEIGGLVGVMLNAAARRIPVVIDGFISSAAALLALKLCPPVRGYLIAAHNSAESGHRLLLNYMKLEPLLDLNMRLGEGTGAALGISLVEAATKALNEMKTFAEAGVSDIK